MIFACITEGGPNSWVVEACSDLWEMFERRLVIGTYADAVKVGRELENKWKCVEG